MKIALVSDIHANLPALETVLDHIRQQGITEIWNAGDLVGYGPYPDEVVCLVQSLGTHSIIGNYDQKVLKFPTKSEKWMDRKKPDKFLAFQWAYQHLSKNSIAYLSELPEEIRLTNSGHKVLITHGSPKSNEEHLSPATPISRLQKLAKLSLSDLVICGHSHQPFSRQANGVWFINPGSVGRPDDGDPRTCYAVLDLEPAQIITTHYRLDYDIERAVQHIRDAGLPDIFAQMLIQGRNLDTLIS